MLISTTFLIKNNFKITCTLDHPILTTNGFKPAQNLEFTDQIITSKGTYTLKKVNINRVPNTPVYDLTVPKYANFTANGIIVHNSKDISDAVAGSIWNCCSQPDKIVNISRLTQSVLDPNGFMMMSDAEKDMLQRLEYEKLRSSFSSGLFRGL